MAVHQIERRTCFRLSLPGRPKPKGVPYCFWYRWRGPGPRTELLRCSQPHARSALSLLVGVGRRQAPDRRQCLLDVPWAPGAGGTRARQRPPLRPCDSLSPHGTSPRRHSPLSLSATWPGAPACSCSSLPPPPSSHAKTPPSAPRRQALSQVGALGSQAMPQVPVAVNWEG